MADKFGNKTGGRQKGTPNKKAAPNFLDLLNGHNYDPLLELIKTLQKEKPTHAEIAEYRESLRDLGIDERETKTMVRRFAEDYLNEKSKADLNIRLLDFIFPKRKAIEAKIEDESEPPSFTINFSKTEKKEGGE